MPATLFHRLDRHGRTVLVIWLVAGALLLLTWTYIVLQVTDTREREVRAASRDLGNLTRVSQEHADRTLHSADQVIRFVQARYLELGNRLDLIKLTEQGIIDAENFPQVGIIDAHGIYVVANRAIASRIDLSDREHFRVHVSGNRADQLFVSKPLLGRATGKWSIQLTRRITLPSGAFGGVVVLSIDPGYFTRFYNDLELGKNGVATLIGMDGISRARQSNGKEEFGTDVSASPLFKRISGGELSGTYTAVSVVDGVARLFHFRRLTKFPLVAVAGLSMDEMLANYRRTRDALILQALIVSLLVVALAAALTRHLGHLRRELEARHAAQDLVQERTAQLDAIFSLSPDGFVGFDASGRVKHVNPAFRQMTGAEDMTFEGLSESDFRAWLLSRCNPATGLPALAEPVGGGGRSLPKRQQIVIANGARVLQVGHRTGESASLSKVMYFRDVTHETAVDQMKSEFLSTAAHELRTPMASIYGFSEVLATQPIGEAERDEFVNIIHEQSGNMARILDELLDLARMEERRGKDFKLSTLDLTGLVRDVIRAYKCPAGRDAPEFVVPDGLLQFVVADVGKLRQAILNVLSNAYKYSPSGGPVRITLSARATGGVHCVGLRITDPGMGMNDAQLTRVFERFYRADKSGKFPGTGLGMSIVKEIVELHHGTVDVLSAPGKGTSVTLWLPIEPPKL